MNSRQRVWNEWISAHDVGAQIQHLLFPSLPSGCNVCGKRSWLDIRRDSTRSSQCLKPKTECCQSITSQETDITGRSGIVSHMDQRCHNVLCVGERNHSSWFRGNIIQRSGSSKLFIVLLAHNVDAQQFQDSSGGKDRLGRRIRRKVLQCSHRPHSIDIVLVISVHDQTVNETRISCHDRVVVRESAHVGQNLQALGVQWVVCFVATCHETVQDRWACAHLLRHGTFL